MDKPEKRQNPSYLTSYFPQYTVHYGLRHICASLLLTNGVPLKQTQQWLGRSDFSTTANIYTHLDYSSKLSSAQTILNDMIFPDANGFKSKWTEKQEKSTENRMKSVPF